MISASLAPSNTGVGHRYAVDQVLAQVEQFLIAELRQIHALRIDRVVVVVDVVQELAQFADGGLGFQHALDLATQALGGPAQMHFQNLADVHTRRHAERVQHDVDRLTGGHVRHVFHRHHVGDHTLVAVAACHLVARLDAALHRQEHLDHLQHARREVVALGDLAALVGKPCFEFFSCAWICFCARSMASAASSSFMRSWNQSDFFSPSR